MTLRDEDDVVPWRVERGLQLRREAQELMARATANETGTHEDREALARKALSLETSAFNWLEDAEWEQAVHDELHSMGQRVHELFPAGCHLEWTGERYEHRCPVRIAHKRFGFSPSMRVGRKLCMICGGDASECPHLPKRLYPVAAGRKADGHCNLCHQEKCDHDEGVEYMTRMTIQITQVVDIDHIAFVARPVQPDARLVGIPISTDGLAEALGPGFVAGVEVHCSLCDLPCTGLDRLDFDPRSNGRALPPQRAFGDADL